MATLKIFADRRSQPTRSVLIFCMVNGIKFEEEKLDLIKGEHLSPKYEAINPMKKVPAISHGDFNLFESHAIMMYLASANKVADHWYPADLRNKARVHSMMDWLHSNLRYGAKGYLANTVLAVKFGKTPDEKAAAQCEKILVDSFTTMESVWLKGNGKFLLGDDQPCIADLLFVTEIMQLHLLPDEGRNKLIGPYKKVQKWIEDIKSATNPHFDEVHKHLFELQKPT